MGRKELFHQHFITKILRISTNQCVLNFQHLAYIYHVWRIVLALRCLASVSWSEMHTGNQYLEHHYVWTYVRNVLIEVCMIEVLFQLSCKVAYAFLSFLTILSHFRPNYSHLLCLWFGDFFIIYCNDTKSIIFHNNFPIFKMQAITRSISCFIDCFIYDFS